MEGPGAEGKAPKVLVRSARIRSLRAHRRVRFVAQRAMATTKIYKLALMELRSKIQYTGPRQELSAVI